MKQQMTLLCCLLPFWALAGTFSTVVPFFEAPYEYVKATALQEQKNVLLHFTTETCTPCMVLEETTFMDEELALVVQENYLAVRINMDAPYGRSYQNAFSIPRLPAIMIVTPEGETLAFIDRIITAVDLQSILESNISTPSNTTTTSSSPEIATYNYTSSTVARPALLPDNHPADPSLDEYLDNTSTPTYESNYQNDNGNRLNVSDQAIPQQPARQFPERQSTPVATVDAYVVQVGVFADRNNAARYSEQLETTFNQPVQLHATPSGNTTVYKITIGQFNDRSQAASFAQQLKENNVEGFVKNQANF